MDDRHKDESDKKQPKSDSHATSLEFYKIWLRQAIIDIEQRLLMAL